MKGRGVIGWVLQMALGPLLRLGRGIGQIFDFLRPTLPNLTQSRVAGAVRAYEVAAQKSETIQGRIATELFSKADLIETDMLHARRYMVKYKFKVLDEKTGQELTIFRNVYEDKLNTPQEWLAGGVKFFGDKFRDTKWRILDAEIHNVYHLTGFSY